MTPEHAQELLALLEDEGLGLDGLHDWCKISGSSWSLDQVRLFLRCVPGVFRDEVTGLYRVHRLDQERSLQDAIREAAESFSGQAVSPAELRRRLPDRFVTTDEQVRALARRTPGLEVIGPGFIRTKRSR